MSIEKPIFWDYATFDENGLSGIVPNAPDEVKESYLEYLRQEEEAKKGGLKL